MELRIKNFACAVLLLFFTIGYGHGFDEIKPFVITASVLRPATELHTFTVGSSSSSSSALVSVHEPTGEETEPEAEESIAEPRRVPSPAFRLHGSLNSKEDEEFLVPTPALLATTRVFGFVDFTTTVSNTVMIFTPQSKANPEQVDSKSKPVPVPSTAIVVAETVITSSPSNKLSKPKIAPSKPSSSTFSVQSTIGIEGLFDNNRNRSSKLPLPKTSKLSQIASSASSVPTKAPQPFTLRPTVAPSPTMHTRVAVSSRVDVRVGNAPSPKVAAQVSDSQKSTRPKMSVRMEVNVATRGAPSVVQSRFVNNLSGTTSPVMGVITTTAGTMIRDGTTTVHETSVVGTLIDGTYARIVQSTSHVYKEKIEPTIVPKLSGKAEVEVVVDEPKIAKAKPSPSIPSAASVTITAAPEQHQNDESSLPLESLFSSQLGPKTAEFKSLPVKLRTNSLNGQERALSDDAYESDEEFEEEDAEDTHSGVDPSFQFLATEVNSVRQTRYAPSEVVSTVLASVGGQHELLPVPQSLIEKRAGIPSFNGNSRSRFASTERNAPNADWNRPSTAQSSNSGFRRDGTRWRYTPAPKPRVPIVKQERRPAPVYEEDPYETAIPASKPSDDEELQEIEPSEVRTLRVQTVTPEGYKGNLYFEIATIKSPYVMRVGTVKNTRYITLTKTFTRAVTPTPPPQLVTPSSEVITTSDPPLDPSLPLTENILATTQPYESILKDSSDIATLPPVRLATDSQVLSLETVTETFSTTELMEKTSILPFVQSGLTSQLTLTQSYYITRLVTAVKTVPAADLYHFIPSNTLRDLSTVLQEAGSEHNEHLLPGEQEFSENDEYDDNDDAPHEHRVLPPPNFQDPLLSSIGSDFDPSAMDKPHRVELQPSLNGELLHSHEGVTVTPPLPQPTRLPFEGDASAAAIQPSQDPHGLTPEQLQQLAIYRYYNPYGALPYGLPGFGGLPGVGGAAANSQIITTTRPVVKTSEIVQTNVVPLWDGAKTIYTTISRTVGTTTVTETELGTTTLTGLANPFQQYTITSSPVTSEIMATSTELRVYRIIFRAQTTYTTVTSTTVFPTIVTSYTTATIPIQPTAFPGLFPNPLGFPGLVG